MLEDISNKLDVFSEEIILIISKEILGKNFEKNRKRRKTILEINVTILLTALVLLIIFMVTAPLLTA